MGEKCYLPFIGGHNGKKKNIILPSLQGGTNGETTKKGISISPPKVVLV